MILAKEINLNEFPVPVLMIICNPNFSDEDLQEVRIDKSTIRYRFGGDPYLQSRELYFLATLLGKRLLFQQMWFPGMFHF